MKKLLSLIALVTCLSASGQIVSLTGVDPVQVTMPATGTRTVAFRKSLTDSIRTAFSQLTTLQKTVTDQGNQITAQQKVNDSLRARIAVLENLKFFVGNGLVLSKDTISVDLPKLSGSFAPVERVAAAESQLSLISGRLTAAEVLIQKITAWVKSF